MKSTQSNAESVFVELPCLSGRILFSELGWGWLIFPRAVKQHTLEQETERRKASFFFPAGVIQHSSQTKNDPYAASVCRPAQPWYSY